ISGGGRRRTPGTWRSPKSSPSGSGWRKLGFRSTRKARRGPGGALPGPPWAAPLLRGRLAVATMGLDVELDRVSVHYGRLAAVDEVSLPVRAGEFFSLLGPSGCGKTTILRLISGFMDPSAGSVRIGGRDMAGIGPERRPTALI